MGRAGGRMSERGQRVERVEAHVLRHPLAVPITTSFDRMASRSAVLVRVVDAEGAEGWGEIWCNFPSCGAEHRARMLIEIVAPALFALGPVTPAQAWAALDRRLHVLGLQAGEPGPVAQALAGLDIALCDLAARRAGVSLWRWLGGGRDRIPAYASGLDPRRVRELIDAARAAGFKHFKVKIGFGREADLAAMRAARDALLPGEAFMVDANQAWDASMAVTMALAMAELEPGWLEEPLAADRPLEEWSRVAAIGVPLAAGENLRGEPAFHAAIKAGALRYLQPDACKWGGLTGCIEVARAAQAAGLTYCPHYLGGAIGLLASAHLLAAAGGDGLLEIDIQENPLRSLLCGPILPLAAGAVALPDGPGLGAAPIAAELARHAVGRIEARAG